MKNSKQEKRKKRENKKGNKKETTTETKQFPRWTDIEQQKEEQRTRKWAQSMLSILQRSRGRNRSGDTESFPLLPATTPLKAVSIFKITPYSPGRKERNQDSSCQIEDSVILVCISKAEGVAGVSGHTVMSSTSPMAMSSTSPMAMSSSY